MNESLRQALLRARLREDDIAARLGVDPKTVRRWLNGRVPYPYNRAAIADWSGRTRPTCGRRRAGRWGADAAG